MKQVTLQDIWTQQKVFRSRENKDATHVIINLSNRRALIDESEGHLALDYHTGAMRCFGMVIIWADHIPENFVICISIEP